MKKIFTLCAAFAAVVSVSAQEREIMSVASDDVQTKIANAIANPIDLSDPNFFIVSQDKQIYPAGTQEYKSWSRDFKNNYLSFRFIYMLNERSSKELDRNINRTSY